MVAGEGEAGVAAPHEPADQPESHVGLSLFERAFAPGGSLHGRDADLVGAVMAGGISAMTLFFAVRGWLETSLLGESAIASLAGLPIYVLAIVGFLTRTPAQDAPRRGEFFVPLVSVVSPGVALNLARALPALWGTPAGFGVAAAGVAIALCAMAHLRRSFAVLPAVRGIVTSGPYRAVRHPLYAGESLYVAGFVLVAVSWAGLLAFAIMLILLGWRILIEERKLSSRKEYQEYARRVRFRLVPGVW
jgi:protein-S-isoprenylcysteine O-methyltransferase Ste14